jgi:hypothetical protein
MIDGASYSGTWRIEASRGFYTFLLACWRRATWRHHGAARNAQRDFACLDVCMASPMCLLIATAARLAAVSSIKQNQNIKIPEVLHRPARGG